MSGVGKSRWGPEEDAALLEEVAARKGAGGGDELKTNWQDVSDALTSRGVARTAKQCRER